MEIGDRIKHCGEEGVVIFMDNDIKIMRTLNFHSYVPIQHDYEIIEKSYSKNENIKDEIVIRIKEYIKHIGSR